MDKQARINLVSVILMVVIAVLFAVFVMAAPTGTVGVGTALISSVDLEQNITITYDEVMDNSTNPVIAFEGSGYFSTDGDGAWDATNTTWTETFTHGGDSEAVIGVNATCSGANNLSGNAQIASINDTFDIDTILPNVTVTMNASTFKIGETAIVTFTFSEAPTGFTSGDVTVGNGAIGAIDSSNPLIQNATFTPDNGVEDTSNIITVGTGWTDAALNAPSNTSDSPNYNIDTIAPACPAPTIVENATPGNQYQIGTTLYFTDLASPGDFNVSISPTDAGSGIQKVNFPNTISLGGDVTNPGPYLKTYNWVYDELSSYPTATITCYDNAGNTNTSNFAVLEDIYPTLSLVTLNNSYVKNGTTIQITTDGSDAGSGIFDCNAKLTATADVAGYNSPVASLGDLGTDCNGSLVIDAADGTYYIGVKPSDNVGLAPNPAFSSAIIMDNIKPNVTFVESDGAIYMAGADPSIQINFSEDVTIPTVSVAPNGSTQTVNNCSDSSAKTWCFSYTLPNLTDSTTETITITLAQDMAGNIMDADATHTFDADTKAPSVGATTLSLFTVFSSYIKGTGTIIGGTATDASLDTASCEYSSDNGSTWSAAAWNTDHCEKTSFAISDGVNYTFNTKINDTAGNMNGGTFTSTYTGDTAAPTTTASAVKSDGNAYTFNTWTNSSYVNITLSCLDGGAGCDTKLYCTDLADTCTPTTAYLGVVQISTASTSYIRYLSNDSLSNVETVKSSTIKIDTSVPVVNSTSPLNDSYLGSANVPFGITGLVSDALSGAVNVSVFANGAYVFVDDTVGGGNWLVVWSPSDGNYNLTYTACDAVGLCSNFYVYNITVDTTAPTGYSVSIDQAYINNANKAAMSFTFAGAEVGTAYNYSIDDTAIGSPVIGNGTVTGATQQITGIDVTTLNDDTLTLSVTLTDVAGNLGNATTDTVTKDVIAPDADFYLLTANGVPYVSGTWSKYVVYMRLNCSDATSGCKYVWQNGYGTPNTNLSAPFNATLLQYNEMEFNGTFRYLGEDFAGNNGTVENISVKIDRIAPTTFDDETGLWHAADYSITLTEEDNFSGIAYTTYRVDAGAWTNGTSISINTDGNHTILYYSVDNAGNVQSTETVYAALDKTKPSPIILSSPVHGSYHATNTSIPFEFTATDTNLANCTINDNSVQTTFIKGGSMNDSGYLVYGMDVTEGLHLWNVTCYDLVGNSNTSANNNFTTDVTSPIVAIDVIPDYVNTVTYSVTGTYTETNLQNISVNGVLATAAGGVYNATISLSSDTNITITVNILDKVGYTNSASDWVVRDTAVPSVTLYAPGNNSYLNDSGVLINFTYTDNFDLSIICSLIKDGLFGGTHTISNGSISAFTYGGVTEGIHTWMMNCTDDAGNSGLSDLITSTVDLTAPEFGNVSNITIFINESIANNFDLTDVTSPIVSNTTDNINANYNTNFTMNASGYFINSTPLVAGTYMVQVTAADAASNVEDATIFITALGLTSELATNSTTTVGDNTTIVVFNALSGNVTEIVIPSSINETTEITLDMSALVNDSYQVEIPNNLTLTREGTNFTYTVSITAGTVITGPSTWDGNITLPTVGNATYSVTGGSVDTVISIGSNLGLNFSLPVQIIIGGMANKSAAWSTGTSLTKITTICNSGNSSNTTAPTNISGTSPRECYINYDSSDLAIWTYHFTNFGAYSRPSGGGGGSGSSSVSSLNIILTNTDTLYTGLTDGDNLKFAIGGEQHIIKVIRYNVPGQYADLELQSTPIPFTLNVGESKVFDLGTEKLYVGLYAVRSSGAELILRNYISKIPLQKLNLTYPKATEEVQEETPVEETQVEGQPVTTTKLKPNSKSGWIVTGIILVVGIGALIIAKGRKKHGHHQEHHHHK